MTMELTGDQTTQIIDTYLKEVKNIQADTCLVIEKDREKGQVLKAKYLKTINIAGITTQAVAEIDEMEIYEVFNHYLSADYDLKRISVKSTKNNTYMDEYYYSTTVTVEIEPVQQKTRNKDM